MWLIHLLFVRSSWIPTKLLRAREFGVPRTTEAPWAIWYASITRYHSSPFVLLGSPPRISSQRPRLGKRALHRPSFFSRKGLKILDPTVQYCYLEKQSQKRALVYIGLARNTLLGRCARAFSLHSTPLHSGRGGGRKFTSTIPGTSTVLTSHTPQFVIYRYLGIARVFSFFANHFGDTEQVSPPVCYSIMRNIHCRSILLFLLFAKKKCCSTSNLWKDPRTTDTYHSSSSSSSRGYSSYWATGWTISFHTCL